MVTNILKFVERHFEECLAVLGTGSFFNQRHEKSDIDLILLSSRINKSYSEKIVNGSFTYDVVVLPIVGIDRIIKEDIVFKAGILVNMLVKSIVLRERNNIAANLIIYAKELKYKFYRSYDQDELKKKIILLYNLTEDLETSTSFLSSFFIASEVSRLLTEITLNRAKAHIGFGKNKASELNLYDSHFGDELSVSLQNYITNADASKLIKLSKKVIEESEIEIEGYSYRDLQTVCSFKEQSYIIRIPTMIISKKNILRRIYDLNIALQSLNLNIIFYELCNDFINIIIRGKNSFSPIDLYRITMHHFSVNAKFLRKVRIMNYSPNNEYYNLLLPLVELLFKQEESCDISLQEKLKVLLNIFDNIIRGLNFQRKEYDSLLKYLQMIWESTGYDKYLKFDYKSLTNLRMQYREKTKAYIDRLILNDIILSPLSLRIIEKATSLFLENSLSLGNKVYTFEVALIEGNVNKRRIVTVEKYLSKVICLFDFEDIKPLIVFLKNKQDETRE